jgi:hypothetical protein
MYENEPLCTSDKHPTKLTKKRRQSMHCGSKKEQEARKARKCRHFRSVLDGKNCQAGVIYKSLGVGSKWPCHGDTGEEISHCSRHEAFSAQEIAERKKESAKWLDLVAQASFAVQKTKGLNGSIDCPRCNGDLRWTRARSNGHTHGQCSGCGLGWMQ